MKRTCIKCKALTVRYGTVAPYRCGLGCNIDRMFGVPQENCPKPLTYDDYVYWSNQPPYNVNKRKSRW